ncbi:hypothetical protein MMC26_003891 [Xylographa opegraphella]|nr:hypothetical protein [Xylographa opegraphella]
MAPSPNITASRVLHISTSRAISQTTNLSTVLLANSFFSIPASQSLTALPSIRRHFWCGRNGFRVKASSNTAIYHKCLEAQQRIAKYKAGRAPLSPIRSGYPFYYRRGQGWRLSSSWGKSENKSTHLLKDKSRAELERERELKSEAEKWQEELNSYLERFRKRVERYPYETLFGASIRRGVWNPWENQLHHWIQSLGKEEWVNTEVTGQHQTPSRGMRSDEASSQTSPVAKDPEVPQPSAVSRASEVRSNDNVEIDLITLRRVQRKVPTLTDKDGELGAGKRFDIPVKSFRPTKKANEPTTAVSEPPVEPLNSPKSDAPKMNETVRPDLPVEPPKTTSNTQKVWLTKEGFSVIRETTSNCESSNQKKESTISASAQEGVPRIESALDRHLRNQDSAPLNNKTVAKPLVYKAEENTTEDIDLLRASNVRAASGRLKKPISEPAGAREKRRLNLRARFEEKEKELEARYAEEIARLESPEVKKPSPKNSAENFSVSVQQASSQVPIQTPSGLETALNKITSEPETTANVDVWGYDLTPKGLETSYQDELDNKVQSLENYMARQQQDLVDAESQKKRQMLVATNAVLEKEIDKQKAAMAAIENKRSDNVQSRRPMTGPDAGEGDISQSVHQFVDRGRWYKAKAPHALEESKQKAKDITLVREIRQIYEDQYGVIDTKHTQPCVNSAMEGKEDPSVQEGLREYEEKIKNEEKQLPIQGKIATTDLDSFEVSRLGQTAKDSNSPPASDTSASQKLSKAEDLKPKPRIAIDPQPEVKTTPGTHVYKILAFDETTQKVAIATTTTSVFESSLPPRSVPAILSYLDQPARYFDHFEPLEAAGFELVAGSRTTLVFKQVQKEVPTPTKAMQDTINKFLQTDLSASSTLTDEGAGPNNPPKSNNELNYDRNIEHTAPSEVEQDKRTTQHKILNHRDQAEASNIHKPLAILEKETKHQPGTVDNLASSSAGNPNRMEQTSGYEKVSTSNPNADLHDAEIHTPLKMDGEQPVEKIEPRTGIDAIRPFSSETTISPKLGSAVNPIDGTTAPPSPFADSNTSSPPINPVSLRPAPRKIVRREEEVFSGRNLTKERYREQRRQQRLASLMERHQRRKKESSKNRRRIWRTAKRVFFTGTWVAACFYLVGALWEEVYRPRERKRGRLEG